MAKKTASKNLFEGIKPVKMISSPAPKTTKTEVEPKPAKQEKVIETENSQVTPVSSNESKTNSNEPVAKRKVGRPGRLYDVNKKTIYFPTTLYNQLEAAPLKLYQGDLTKYICSLIEKDLSENEAMYKALKDMTPVLPKSMEG